METTSTEEEATASTPSTPSTRRVRALLRAVEDVQLPPAREGAPPGPVVPSHVAGLVKRILSAFRVGVPFEVLLSSSFHCTPEDLPSEVRRWLEHFCSSRLLKSCNELGNKQTVDLCKSEVDDILPMACCANYTFSNFLEINVEAYEEEKTLVFRFHIHPRQSLLRNVRFINT